MSDSAPRGPARTPDRAEPAAPVAPTLPAPWSGSPCTPNPEATTALACQGCAVLAGGEDEPLQLEAAELASPAGRRQAVGAVLRAWRYVAALPEGRLWPGWSPAGTPLLLALRDGGGVLVAEDRCGDGLQLDGSEEAIEGFQTLWVRGPLPGPHPCTGEAPARLAGQLFAAFSLPELMQRCPSQRAGDLAAGAFRVHQRQRWAEPAFDPAVAYPRRHAEVNALGRVEGWLLHRLVSTGDAAPRPIGLFLQARRQRRRLLAPAEAAYERAVERLEGSAMLVARRVYRELGAQERADRLLDLLDGRETQRHWHWRGRFPLTGMAMLELLAALGADHWEGALAAGATVEDLVARGAAGRLGNRRPNVEDLLRATPLDAWRREEVEHADAAKRERRRAVEGALAGRELRCLLPEGARLQLALSGVDALEGVGRLWEAPLELAAEGLSLRLDEGWLLQAGRVLRVPLAASPAWETEGSWVRLTAGGLAVEAGRAWQVARGPEAVVLTRSDDTWEPFDSSTSSS